MIRLVNGAGELVAEYPEPEDEKPVDWDGDPWRVSDRMLADQAHNGM